MQIAHRWMQAAQELAELGDAWAAFCARVRPGA
jgi:hypothetical protein